MIQKSTILLVILLLLLTPLARADDAADTTSKKDTKSSKWFATPLLTSDPKISTAVGALGGYMHTFDEASPPSLFGVAGTYSTTDSWYAGIFAKTHFGKDVHRLMAGAFTGQIHNDYSDYLGSGLVPCRWGRHHLSNK